MSTVPSLDEVIAGVIDEAGSAEPLDQLATAVQFRHQLDELADDLLDHFVEQARENGCSWSQIGAALGVTKQAAQQRHVADDSVARRLFGRVFARDRSSRRPSFHRFRVDSRSVVVIAQEEARALAHNHIGTEHVLLALLREDSVAKQALSSVGVSYEAAYDELVKRSGRGDVVERHLPFTPRVKKVLKLSLREAINLKHNYIGPEHIVLAIARENDGEAMAILGSLGVNATGIRNAVEEHMGLP